MDRYERLLQRWFAVAWLALTLMALRGAWRGRLASGRKIGRPFPELPRWVFLAIVLPYMSLVVRLWRPLPVRLSPVARLTASVCGAALSLLGIGLVVWGRVALGRMYNISSSLGVRLYAHQELITSGPFALVRHPMYLGAMLAAIGSMLLYRTWTVLFLLIHVPVFWVRAWREEEALEAEFGHAWRAYARRVPAGIPAMGMLRAIGRRSGHGQD